MSASWPAWTRAAVLCHIMRWGLTAGPTATPDQGQAHGPVRPLHLSVDADVQARAAQAASAAGLQLAPWLRTMVRQIPLTAFPPSWQAARVEARSHDSRRYGTRVMLRLDVPSAAKLQHLVTQFGASKAGIIRRLIRHATLEDFPESWHLRAAERRARQAPHPKMGSHREPHR